MPVLYTFLGIILFFVLVFSIPLGVTVDYAENTVVCVKWLFLKFTVVDTSKPEKEKKKKKKKDKKGDEKLQDEVADNPKGKKSGDSLVKQIYRDHGYDGLIKLLRDIGKSLSSFFGKLWKTFTIDELYIEFVTASGDAAQTAIMNGKLSAWAYPILGKLVSTCKVRKYNFDISPDFLAVKSTAKAYARLHIIPIKVTNAVVVLAFELLFRVVLKLLGSFSKNKKNAKMNAQTVAEGEEQVSRNPQITP